MVDHLRQRKKKFYTTDNCPIILQVLDGASSFCQLAVLSTDTNGIILLAKCDADDWMGAGLVRWKN